MDIEASGGLMNGFQLALTPVNLMHCLIGVFLGTMIGVLPGLGPTVGMAVLIPLIGALDVAGALIMMAGIYYGAQYGGSTTAILINVPGDGARWSPAWTATRWRSRAAPARRWGYRPSAPS